MRGEAMATPLSLPVLARLWQTLLKGNGELSQAPSPQLALEMVLIRTAYMANLPSPADLVRQIQDGAGAGAVSAVKPTIASPTEAVPPKPQAVGAMPVGEIATHKPPPPLPPPTREQPPVAVAPIVSAEDAPPSYMDDAPPFEDEMPAVAEALVAAEEHPVPESFAEFVRYLDARKIEPLLTARLRNQVPSGQLCPGRGGGCTGPGR